MDSKVERPGSRLEGNGLWPGVDSAEIYGVIFSGLGADSPRSYAAGSQVLQRAPQAAPQAAD